jgi:hypothetical protein
MLGAAMIEGAPVNTKKVWAVATPPRLPILDLRFLFFFQRRIFLSFSAVSQAVRKMSHAPISLRRDLRFGWRGTLSCLLHGYLFEFSSRLFRHGRSVFRPARGGIFGLPLEGRRGCIPISAKATFPAGI